MGQRLSAALLLARAAAQVFQPNQVHLSFTGEASSIGIDFVTDLNVACNATGVAFGASPSALTTWSPSASCFKLLGVGFQNQVLLTGLTAGSTYYYTAGSQTAKNWAWSEVFTFTMPDLRPAARPLTAAVYADFGFTNSASLFKQGAFNYVIHAGDFVRCFVSTPRPLLTTAHAAPSYTRRPTTWTRKMGRRGTTLCSRLSPLPPLCRTWVRFARSPAPCARSTRRLSPAHPPAPPPCSVSAGNHEVRR